MEPLLPFFEQTMKDKELEVEEAQGEPPLELDPGFATGSGQGQN
jgi:hypothetical protein